MLRRRVQRKRSSDDDFVFDIVVVPSFEDALIATLVNFNLQAVVIRHGFPFRSVNRSSGLLSRSTAWTTPSRPCPNSSAGCC